MSSLVALIPKTDHGVCCYWTRRGALSLGPGTGARCTLGRAWKVPGAAGLARLVLPALPDRVSSRSVWIENAISGFAIPRSCRRRSQLRIGQHARTCSRPRRAGAFVTPRGYTWPGTAGAGCGARGSWGSTRGRWRTGHAPPGRKGSSNGGLTIPNDWTAKAPPRAQSPQLLFLYRVRRW